MGQPLENLTILSAGDELDELPSVQECVGTLSVPGGGMIPALAAVVGAENRTPVPCGSAVGTRLAPAIAGALAQYCLRYPRSFDNNSDSSPSSSSLSPPPPSADLAQSSISPTLKRHSASSGRLAWDPRGVCCQVTLGVVITELFSVNTRTESRGWFRPGPR